MSHRKNKTIKPKNHSKQTSWEKFSKYIDRVFDWSYDTKSNRYDKNNGKINKLPIHIITKENTKKNYCSQAKKYCQWVYQNKGETNLRYYKKSWFDEYLNNHIINGRSKNTSASSLYTQIAALTKFENILEAKWKKDTGEEVQFGIIADQRIRTSLKGRNFYRNIEDMKKSRPISDKEIFLAIENELDEPYQKLWRFLGVTGMRLESALLFQKQHIIHGENPYLHIKHGKAGKRSDVHLLNPELIGTTNTDITNYVNSISQYVSNFAEEHSEFKNERRIFDNFKKTVKNGTNLINVNKKLSTIKTDFEKVVREAGKKLNLHNITAHSARKYFCNSIYEYFNKTSEVDVNKLLLSNSTKYEATFRKELSRINSKRKFPRNFDYKNNAIIPLMTFKDVLNFFTHEEKAALLSSVESSHHRLSILSFYINRKVFRKKQGTNTWFKDNIR